MKASQFSDAQKAFILKQGDEGVTVAEICRKAGISQALTAIGKGSTL
jgi:putative transposase